MFYYTGHKTVPDFWGIEKVSRHFKGSYVGPVPLPEARKLRKHRWVLCLRSLKGVVKEVVVSLGVPVVSSVDRTGRCLSRTISDVTQGAFKYVASG